MGASTLTHAWEQSETEVRGGQESPAQSTAQSPARSTAQSTDAGSRDRSPGTRFLDALTTGDELGVLDTCGPTTTMSAHNMGWSCQGPDEILGMIGEARRCFPGLTVEPRTRNIGFGLVIDEVRVQEPISAPDTAQSTASTASTEAGETDSDGESHPMWESPVSEQRTVAVWREDYLTPMRLNLPVRVTVHHDDLQVHEVTMEFPAALLKRALGMYVDPLEMSLSEVQSAVIAPVEAGFTMRTLDGPELSSTSQEPPEDDPETAGEKRPRHRRRRILVPALVALVGVAAAGGWWVAQGRPALNVGAMPWASSASTGQSGSSAPNTQPNSQPSTQQSAQVAATQVSTSLAPVVTHAKPSETPSGKPNVTLASALAFTFNSATLSPQAKTAIGHLAQEVRSHGLTGKIYVDGYTDDLGSASHGLVLSQQRADAVSHYLGSRLVGVPVTIVSTGHGEAHPVADNKTAAGRRANRRVAITLPTS